MFLEVFMKRAYRQMRDYSDALDDAIEQNKITEDLKIQESISFTNVFTAHAYAMSLTPHYYDEEYYDEYEKAHSFYRSLDDTQREIWQRYRESPLWDLA